LPTLTVLVTVLGFTFTVWQYRVEQQKNRVATEQRSIKDAAERAEQARKDTETAQRSFMRPLLEKQQQLYFEAAVAAATIASSNDSTERHSAEAKFWVLYYGPLVMVEAKDMDEAMVNFGRCVSGDEKCSRDDLKNRSLGLASTLEASMLKAWNAKPNEFTRNRLRPSLLPIVPMTRRPVASAPRTICHRRHRTCLARAHKSLS
jgi:hypothetical protein